MAFIVLDDFFSDLKSKGLSAFNAIKSFAQDNGHLILPLVQKLVSSVSPQLAAIVESGSRAFGGKILS